MRQQEEFQKCEAVLMNEKGSFECDLKAGHDSKPRPKGVSWSQKHRNNGMSWTNQGADRCLRELKQKKEVESKVSGLAAQRASSEPSNNGQKD
jgi:hypothetical protein